MMTKKIHQIWLQGYDDLPENYKTYSNKYQQLNPIWEYKLWSLDDIRNLIKEKYPHLLGIWENYDFWVMRVDLGKYCILDAFGGLLIDMDTEPLLPLDGFLPIDKAMVIEHTNTFWHRLIGVKKTTNNNFLYIPYPNHPLSTKLVSRACCTAGRLPFEFKFYHVLGSIGPLFLIDAINEISKDEVLWVPNEVAKEYFADEAANSWNKSLFDDDHDVKWGIFFLAFILLVIFALWRSFRRR